MGAVYHLTLAQQLDFTIVQTQFAQAALVKAYRIHRKRIGHLFAGLGFLARHKGRTVLPLAAMLVKEALF